ncbi:MAG: hypothetical protein ABIL58_19530, partial [Pseudomonadota bacterium]
LRGEVRYAALEKTFPAEAKKLHAELEEQFALRYLKLKQMAEAAPVMIKTEGTPEGAASADTDACVLSDTAEHSAGAGEACDDGRAGK